MAHIKKIVFLSIVLGVVFIDSAGAEYIISTVAGKGTKGFSGDGGGAVSAELNNPYGVSIDTSGNIYIADTTNCRIRKVDTSGIISSFAGNGTLGNSGDSGAAVSAQLNFPMGTTLDTAGNVYISDYINNRIRKVSASGIISTIAGNGFQGFAGDGGSATTAQLFYPIGTAFDASGNMYIADYSNNRIRKVDTSGIITTFAGTGVYGYSGDGGPAIAAKLYQPSSVALDASGNVYIADQRNDRIRKVDTNGIITTFAGNGTGGYSGDGGSAASARLLQPSGVTVDASGNLYIADQYNNRVRKVDTLGIISTIAGSGTQGYFGDGGNASSAELFYPTSVAVDVSGNILVADQGNNRIRKIIYTETGIFSGRITRPDGVTGIPMADIKALKSGVVISSTTSDINGNYTIKTATGTYDIKASMSGYLAQVKTGYLLANGSTVTVYFSLIDSLNPIGTQERKKTTLGDNLFSPKNGATCKIGFFVSQPGGVTIKICDIMGRQVRSAFDNSSYAAGTYQWDWDGKDDSGTVVPPGLYILYFKYPGGSETRKIGVE